MYIKIIISTIAILISLILLFFTFKMYNKIKGINRDESSGMFPKYKNYLDFYLGLLSIVFMISGITIIVI